MNKTLKDLWKYNKNATRMPERWFSLEGCAYAQPKVGDFSLLESFDRKCPLGCSLGRPHPISSMATGTSPFTGYLPRWRFIASLTVKRPHYGQKAPLGRILHNFRLRMRTPKGTPFGVTLAMVLYYCITFCTTTIVRIKCGKWLRENYIILEFSSYLSLYVSSIWGRSISIWGGATGNHVTGSDVIGSGPDRNSWKWSPCAHPREPPSGSR
jgi:hypothetical protein